MPDLLTNINSELEDLLATMTTGGGYNYTWLETSINPLNRDFAEAIVTTYAAIFPVAFIHYGPENVVKPTMSQLAANGQTYTNDIDFRLEVFLGASNADVADVQINKAISDLKKLLFNNDCLDGNAFVLLYTGHGRDTAFADAEGCAGRLFFDITIRYNQDITNPEVLA